MCILVFSSFSAEISELKADKARMHNGMHNVQPGCHTRVLPGWLELLPGWLEFLPGWLESLPGWLES